jgi:hypothetical protein
MTAIKISQQQDNAALPNGLVSNVISHRASLFLIVSRAVASRLPLLRFYLQ